MAPTNPKNIVVEVKGVAVLTNDYVIINNLSRSGARAIVKIKRGSGTQVASAIVEKGGANSSTVWESGDVINATLQGRLKGSTEATITKSGGLTLSITGSADTSSVAVDL